ncbi:MAG: hypothetical protein HYR85_28160 [Planctomycetes bacterium]|nr:hypothetical protein [Planctomycetota bacterium]MBI3846248.1 hypothetical protein [Planctomycetota bacterium]
MKAATETKSDRGLSDAAVFAKTGKHWEEWFALLDKAGAKKMNHSAIAAHLHDDLGCPGWWSQMVTVGYERERGLRVKHQTATGFTVNGSKTVGVPLATLWRAWTDAKKRAKWLRDPGFVVRKQTAERSMRITWVDGETNVDVLFTAKGAAKSQVNVEHAKLADIKAVERMKKYWGDNLDSLQKLLEG